MTETLFTDDDPPTITIRNSVTGEAFDWNPGTETWLDLRAFAAAANLTIEQLINLALERFLREHPHA
jgi:hypothetical protein